MGFNFFKISKNLYNEFKGIAGSNHKVKIYLTTRTFEEGKARGKVEQVMVNTNCLITDLSNREKLTYETYEMKGRKIMSFRFIDKTGILEKLKDIDFNNMKSNESYIEWNGEKYTIIQFLSYTNANMIRFIGVYAGE